MKIAIVVHGRFDAFDLVQALLRQGEDVRLFTNYPKHIVKKFGISPSCVETYIIHGILTRLLSRLCLTFKISYPEAWLHRLFGKWAANALATQSWDVIHCWSGVSEEILDHPKLRDAFKILCRGSSHIQEQFDLLSEEERRVGSPMDRPSPWMIRRETREYTKADGIRCLSKFAYQSFIAHDCDKNKVLQIESAMPTHDFKPPSAWIDTRIKRIQSGKQLNILYVGNVSFQKGFYDLVKIIREIDPKYFRLTLVGAIMNEVVPLLNQVRDKFIVIGKVDQGLLKHQYRSADLFLFPTIQDGYAQVIGQALVSGVPTLATTNCSAPDLIKEGLNGWVVPIRRPDLMILKLQWCHEHRDQLARMVHYTHHDFRPTTWDDTAKKFVGVCARKVRERQSRIDPSLESIA